MCKSELSWRMEEMLSEPHLHLTVVAHLKLFHFTSAQCEWLSLQEQLWTDLQTCIRQTELQDYIFQGKHIRLTHTCAHILPGEC